MKKSFAILLCLVSSAVFAAPMHSDLPKYVKVSQIALGFSKPVKAQLECNLYSFDNDYNPTFLTSENSRVFDVGTITSMAVPFPAPYQDYSVYFEHELVSFAIDRYETARPYITSSIIRSGGEFLDSRNATFMIENARKGSHISLDTIYRYDDQVLLYSLCSINFVK